MSVHGITDEIARAAAGLITLGERITAKMLDATIQSNGNFDKYNEYVSKAIIATMAEIKAEMDSVNRLPMVASTETLMASLDPSKEHAAAAPPVVPEPVVGDAAVNALYAGLHRDEEKPVHLTAAVMRARAAEASAVFEDFVAKQVLVSCDAIHAKMDEKCSVDAMIRGLKEGTDVLSNNLGFVHMWTKDEALPCIRKGIIDRLAVDGFRAHGRDNRNTSVSIDKSTKVKITWMETNPQ